MSARLNLSIGIGTLAVMLIMSFSNLYFTNQGKEQSEQNARDIQHINSILTDFIKDRNIAFNQTFTKIDNVIQQTDNTQSRLLNISQLQHQQEAQLLELAKNQTLILKAQNELINQFNQTNEKERAKAVDRIIDAVNNETRRLFEQYNK